MLASVIAFGYAFFLYRKDQLLSEVNAGIRWTLAIFRFLTVFTICFLLLGLILEKFTERKERPLLFIANDNSGSVLLNKDSTFYKTTYLNELSRFSEDLSGDFEVVEYDFSTDIVPGFSGSFDGKSTDLSLVFNTIFDQYTNRNIGGIVLASDGIYNAGSNPIYAIARKSFIPIFTVGLGDTNLVKDARIQDVIHNDIAFLGNDFPIEVSVSQSMCQGEKAIVSIFDGEQLIKQERIEFTEDQSQVKLQFITKANRVGFRKYRAEISELSNEFSTANNTANFYVEVIDGRQKILMTYQAPHPDVAALRSVIETNKNYEAELKQIDEVSSLNGYDLVIIHNYVGGNKVLSDYIENGVGPVLFIVGVQSDLAAMNKLEIGFNGRFNDTEDVLYVSNPAYKEILIAPKTIQLLANAPPLQAPFGSVDFSGAIDVLAYQKVGNIVLDMPLIYFSQKVESRFGVIMGEGIWRWRLYEQMKNQNTEGFADFFGKIITFLAVKENKDPFRIQIANEFTENEDVVVGAELYNKSFDLMNDPEVKFMFENDNGDEFESYFVRTANAYQLELGKLPQGYYTWTASTSFQDKVYQKSGSFIVREVKIEVLNTVANHRILNSIAENSGGGFYLASELSKLQSDLKTRDDMVTVVYQEKEFDDLIDYKWVFFLLVLLVSVEWFVRKFQGAY